MSHTLVTTLSVLLPVGLLGWVRWGPFVLVVAVYIVTFLVQLFMYNAESLTLVFSSVFGGALASLGLIAPLKGAYMLEWPFAQLAHLLQGVAALCSKGWASFRNSATIYQILLVCTLLFVLALIVSAIGSSVVNKA